MCQKPILPGSQDARTPEYSRIKKLEAISPQFTPGSKTSNFPGPLVGRGITEFSEQPLNAEVSDNRQQAMLRAPLQESGTLLQKNTDIQQVHVLVLV